MDTYEKKYKEALERAREWYNDSHITIGLKGNLETIFPELKESEDERIRKAILNHLKKMWGNSEDNVCGVHTEDAIAWLEKQESVEEIVERCKNSWYNEGKIQGQIEGLTDEEKYQQGWHDALEKQGKHEIECPQNHQDMNHPNGCIVLEDFNGGEGFYKLNLDYLNKKQVEEIEEIVRVWNRKLKDNENIKDCIGMCLTDVHEQRFKDYNTTLKDCLIWLEKQGEQKPISNIRYEVGDGGSLSVINGKPFDYENANIQQKDFAEQKPAWSEEDEEISKGILNYLCLHDACELEGFDSWYNWLKSSLKDKVQSLSRPKEWSEEDENVLEDIEEAIINYWHGDTQDILLSWLKSLKDKVQPQNRWKPSENDIDLLERMRSGDKNYNERTLYRLIKNLKKLREG